MSSNRIVFRCHQASRWARSMATAVLVALSCCQIAHAVDYTWENVDAAYSDQRAVSTQKVLKDQVLLGRSSFGSNRAAVESWYRKYLFPAMASVDRLGDLYDNRESLNKDLEAAGRTDQATHQFLVDLAYAEATKLATGNYHPAVRFNAMLMIGSLNQVESRMTERLPAIRLPKAFDFMVDELKKPDQVDVVRVAAMLGVERHLRLVRQRPQDQPIADGRKAEVAALMKTLAEEKTPPATRSSDGHIWLRRGAVDVLAALGQVGDAQSIFSGLVNIVGDSSEPLSLRCTAARALSQLNYTDVTGIDAVATTQKLGALAAYACRNEDSRVKDAQKELEEKKKRERGGMGGYGGMSGYSGMSGGYPGMGDEMSDMGVSRLSDRGTRNGLSRHGWIPGNGVGEEKSPK